MPFYRCLMVGENFRFHQEGKIELLGFCVTCWVEADVPADAEMEAIAQLRSDPMLARPDWYDGSEPRPSVYVEEIVEVTEPKVQEREGFAFFPMEE